MIIKLKWGDPMFEQGQRVDTIDLSGPREEAAQKGLGYIYQQLRYFPHFVYPGAKFTDGLNSYTVLEMYGPRFTIDDIYTSQNRDRCKPVKIVAARKFMNMLIYLCEIGYQGHTRRYWKTEWGLLKHLKGQWWLSWLP